MIDPLLIRIVAIAFGLLWLASALHKLAARDRFAATLENYRLLPLSWVAAVARSLPWLEGILGVAWLLAVRPRLLVPATCALLGLYAAAIAVNLLRGRAHIACGCSLSPAGREGHISWWLVLRNLALAASTAVVLLPALDRSLGVGDYAVIAVALAATGLLQAAARQLLRNGAALTGAIRDE